MTVRQSKAEKARQAGQRPQDIKLARRSPDELSETEISAKIATWLRKLGAVCIRVNSGVVVTESGHHFHGAPKGTSDRICGIPVMTSIGLILLFVGIEVKRPGKKPTPKQQAFIDKINALGGIAFYADGVDDAKRQLNERLRERFGVSNEHEGR